MYEPNSAIELRGVRKTFGATIALHELSMTIRPGESRALVGRNGAGKSTLVSLLTGVARADTGEVLVDGVGISDVTTAVGCVYQHSHLVPEMTVAENMFIRAYPVARWRRIDWAELNERAAAALRPWGMAHLVEVQASQLEPVQKKVVEICRSLLGHPKVVILDEPTAGLDRKDALQLFRLLEDLRERHVTLLYVSHHLEEIYEVCDSVTVLRDARHVLTSSLRDLPINQLISAMVGEVQPLRRARARASQVGETVLDVDEVSVPGRVGPISFTARAGECIGIAGIDGSGKIELARAIVGLQKREGSVRVRGASVRQGDVAAAIRAGIGFVPEDRGAEGYIPELDVSENATMSAAPFVTRRVLGLLRVNSRRVRDRIYAGLADSWKIKAESPRTPISALSGGNQQKVVMARAIGTSPQVLILINPTAGVDVSAKSSITASLEKVLERGAAVVVVSEDPDDFVLCARILVMVHGKISRELGTDWTDAKLMALMQGAE